MKSGKTLLAVVAVLAILSAGIGTYMLARASTTGTTDAKSPVTAEQDSVSLSDQQSQSVKVSVATARDFSPTSAAVGYIDFDQDRSVQVFSPYQGVVKEVFIAAGDDVRKGQVLFSIQSPDLIQAESNLITTAGVLDLTTKALDRTRQMLASQGSAQRDVEQATSDQQTADANHRAARNAVRLFGKSEAEIDRVIAMRKIDGELRIYSPLDGRVTTRNVSPGLLVQPGTAPAPVAVADLSTLWMIANVSEAELPALKKGQSVKVMVDAYPGRIFQGTLGAIGAAVDPATHRVAVRSEIRDPRHELHPQMLASFLIQTGSPQHLVALPEGAVVREGDGTMTAFVTKDNRRFARREIQLGEEEDGFYPVLKGLAAGERVANEGAIFLSNALALQSQRPSSE